MSEGERGEVAVFDQDAISHGGYVYTTSNRLSSRLALQRMIAAITSVKSLAGRSVLDIGCGDGYFTQRYREQGCPRLIVGVDPAGHAVKVARSRLGGEAARVVVGDGHRLPFGDDSFDLALLQGVLHHDGAPRAMIGEAMRVAREILILEPNGYNPGLKVIEKVSRYHRQHGEKSYPPRRLRRWIEGAGGKILHQEFAGFVPIFCSDWLARLLKGAEPIVERVPIANALGCAYCVILARRRTRDAPPR